MFNIFRNLQYHFITISSIMFEIPFIFTCDFFFFIIYYKNLLPLSYSNEISFPKRLFSYNYVIKTSCSKEAFLLFLKRRTNPIHPEFMDFLLNVNCIQNTLISSSENARKGVTNGKRKSTRLKLQVVLIPFEVIRQWIGSEIRMNLCYGRNGENVQWSIL